MDCDEACAEVLELAARPAGAGRARRRPVRRCRARTSTRKWAWPTTSRTRLRCGRWISSACCWRRCCPDAELLARLVAPRALGLLAVAPAFEGRPGVPASWAVTSDSLAVLAAGAIGAEEAILLKPVRSAGAWPSDDATAARGRRGELRALQVGGGEPP